MAVGCASPPNRPVILIAGGWAGLEGARRDVEAQGRRALVRPLDVADADAVREVELADLSRRAHDTTATLGAQRNRRSFLDEIGKPIAAIEALAATVIDAARDAAPAFAP